MLPIMKGVRPSPLRSVTLSLLSIIGIYVIPTNVSAQALLVRPHLLLEVKTTAVAHLSPFSALMSGTGVGRSSISSDATLQLA